MTYHYRIVDVFTQTPLEGNPLAVFVDARGLRDATMQSIARELNLSETVFIFPSTRADCAANVRIFTPTREMLFAGHPTVGAAFVMLDEGMVPAGAGSFALEEKVGRVPVRVEGSGRPLIWLTTPPIHDGPKFDRKVCAAAVGLSIDDLLECEPQLLSAGNPTIFIPVKSKEAVDRAWMDMAGMAHFKNVHAEGGCVFVFAPVPEGAYSRMFAPEYGIIEDPATGSSTGPLAAYMIRHKLAPNTPRFVSEQGTKMGRRSLLHVRINDGSIEVGGYVTPLVRAEMRLGIE